MTPRLLLPLLTALATAVALCATVPAAAAAGAPAAASSARTTPQPAQKVARAASWKPRPARWSRTVTRRDIPIPMSDGTILRGDLRLPATSDGKAVTQRLPVLVAITPYNKSLPIGTNGGSILGSGMPKDYLVTRGYAELWVDARGTGSSEGRWDAFSAREQKDAGEIVAWTHRQPWSNGRIGMQGGSYLGVQQLFAAEQQPPGLRAIFPMVPSGDPFRDVTTAGGQMDASFVPQFFLLVSAAGALPPMFSFSDVRSALTMAFQHLAAGLGTTLPEVLTAGLTGNATYDDFFSADRKPITHIDKVKVPTFIVGGEHDIFQRSEPQLFEALAQGGVPVRFIDGPWTHLEAGSGDDLPGAGYGTLGELQLRWFDHWLKGLDTDLDQIPPLTYYEQGAGRWVRRNAWLADDLAARTYRLSGSSTDLVKHGGLTVGTAAAGTSTLVPLPVSGVCSESTDQWTGGLISRALGSFPCADNRLNDTTGLVFDSAPMKEAVRIQGQINAHLYVSTTTGDGMLSVALEDVAPDGSVHRLSGGWQQIAQRALDRRRSRYLDGKLIQPWHPFLRSTKHDLAPGTIAPVDVEIFPTGAAIQPAHRLRLAVQGYDVPHLSPTLQDGAKTLGPMHVYAGGSHPSSVTMPVR